VDDHELGAVRSRDAVPEPRAVGEPGDVCDLVDDERRGVPREHALRAPIVWLLRGRSTGKGEKDRRERRSESGRASHCRLPVRVRLKGLQSYGATRVVTARRLARSEGQPHIRAPHRTQNHREAPMTAPIVTPIATLTIDPVAARFAALEARV